MSLKGYVMRGSIEQVFQQITEVFHLEDLITSMPKGTIFQAAFCLLIYNVISPTVHARCGILPDKHSEKLIGA